MVWFQCEDCGENLKKPKLPNHFRICSAYKLSCIDCGEIFTQQTVQSHMQCITEAEKYGPKNQAKPAQNAQIKEAKPKPNLDVDINVGLSTRPPWFCSLCNTTTTSKQTLLLHADGKKHRNKAKAFHASKNQIAGPTNKEELNGISEIDSSEKKIAHDLEDVKVASSPNGEKKRKIDALNQVESNDSVNGEVIQSNKSDAKSSKKSKNGPQSGQIDHINVATNGREDDSSDGKIKWKKMIVSILKSNPEGVLKVKKLQKLVTKSLLESGVAEPKDQLQIKLIEKITSSSRFIIDGKYVHLTKKTKSS